MNSTRIRIVVIGLLTAALAAFPLLSDSAYYQNMAIMAFLLAIMASAWNVISGYTGYVSLGQSAFLGIGAYTTALLAIHLEISPFVAAPAGGAVAAAAALLLGLAGRRTRGIAFVIVSFAFLELAALLASEWSSLTNGNHGLPLPLPTWDRAYQNWPFYYSLFGLLLLTVWGSWAIRRSKLGIGLLAIRDDESKADGVGVRTDLYKMLGFAASAFPIGLAGGVYGYYVSYLEPAAMFDIVIAMQIVLAAHLGGVGTLWGPVVGAFLLEPLTQLTNQSLSGPDAGSWRLVIYGSLLSLIVLFFPKGLLPEGERLIKRLRGTGTGPVAGRRLSDPPGALPALAVTELRRPEPAEPGSPLLVVDGLRKSFGGLVAVDDCSFTVERGSVTALIGPNGSGKTTVFNLLDGSLRADGGTIRLEGRQVEALPRWKRAHLGLARTYQATRVFPRLTALENLAVPSRSFSARNLRDGAVGGKDVERAREWLDFVGMSEYAGQPAGQLSYGQQKLIELAQALMLRPRLLFLDEPAAGINPTLVERLSDIIRRLHETDMTVLIVEHNMPMVLGLCDQVHVLAQGRVLASGPPGRIERDPAVLDAYLGEHGSLATATGATS